MLGKTHLSVGVATSLAIMQPKNITELVIGCGAAAIGGVISDIDVSTSHSHKDANKIIALTGLSILTVFTLDYFFQLNIFQKILNNSSFLRILTGFFAFIGICAYGKEMPHRSFMHSFLALAFLLTAIWLIFPPLIPYFTIAFVSHLTTDLLNYKKVKLFYPMHKGFCLHLFHAHGIANSIFYYVASATSIIEIIYLLH